MELQSRPFGVTRDGQAVTCYTLVSDNGCTAEILDYGATIRAITVPDRDGRAVDVALGYDTLAEYQENSGSMGATVGRFANRIAKGRFTLNGVEYQLAVNNGPNHLHGGLLGFERQVWQAEETAEGLRFTLVSPDGQDGYPGTMTVSVTFSWAGSALTLRYRAVSDKDTVLNLTNHCYFTLDGPGKILDHTLTVAAETFNEGDPDCLPTGRLLPVAGTAMDFRTPRPIGEAVDSDEACVKLSGGYDSNFVLSGSPAAVLRSGKSGIVMTVTTDQPGVQVYSSNFLTDRKGKNGASYGLRSGLCLETQHFPDAIHHPEWPSCILKAGDTFESYTTFAFSAE